MYNKYKLGKDIWNVKILIKVFKEILLISLYPFNLLIFKFAKFKF
jgi:hypothetical protein